MAKEIDTNNYELNVISPRNHFLFTPLLPSTATGTIEFRGIIEPIRRLRGDLNYVQASVIEIDPIAKTVKCEGVYPSSFDPINDPLHYENVHQTKPAQTQTKPTQSNPTQTQSEPTQSNPTQAPPSNTTNQTQHARWSGVRRSGEEEGEERSEGGEKPIFTMRYDELVIGVGAQSATFGVEGAEEFCYMFKQVKKKSKKNFEFTFFFL